MGCTHSSWDQITLTFGALFAAEQIGVFSQEKGSVSFSQITKINLYVIGEGYCSFLLQ